MPQRLLSRFGASTVARRITGVFLGFSLAKGLNFLAILLLLRFLTEPQWALFVAFQAVRMLCPRLVWDGIATAMVRYASEYRSESGLEPMGLFRKSVLLALAIYLGLMLAGLAGRGLLAQLLFGRADYAHAVVAGLLGGVGYLLVLQQNRIYQAREEFRRYVGIILAQSVLLLAYVAGLAAMGWLHFVTIAYGLLALDLLVGGVLLAGSLTPRGATGSVASSHTLGQVFLASGLLMVYHITLVGFSQLDVMMLSHLAGQRELAQYGVAFRFYTAALLLLGAIQAVLLPHFSRRRMQGAGEQRRFVGTWFRHMVWVAVPLVLLNLLGRPLYVLLTGQRYAESFGIWVILSIGAFISLMCSPMVSILISRSRFAVVLLLGLSALVFNVAGNLALIPLIGGRGAAVATIASHAVVNVSAVLIVLFGAGEAGKAPQPAAEQT